MLPDSGTSETKDLRTFVAHRVLHATQIPIHFVWHFDAVQNIQLDLPVGFEVVELNNAETSGDVPRIQLTPTTPGYIGLALKAPHLEEAEKTYRILATVARKDGTNEVIERPVRIFRPVVELGPRPSKRIIVRHDDKLAVSEQIRLANVGAGTAVLHFSAPADSKIPLQPSSAMQELREGLKRELLVGIPKMQARYSARADLLAQLVPLFFPDSPGIDRKQLQALDDYLDTLLEAMANDEMFARDLQETFTQAFLRNIQLSTVAGEFVEFMKSVGGNKLILVNPFDSFPLKPGENHVSVRVGSTDRSTNSYPAFVLENIILQTDREEKLPVYKLFALEEKR